MKEKKIYRSDKNRILGGVCGGIGDYFDIDPVLIRLVFVLLTIAGGAGVLVYVISWIIIPEEPERLERDNEKSGTEQIHEKAAEFAKEIKETVQKNNGKDNEGRIITGLVILALGFLFLFQNVFHFNVWSIFWPVILIAIGLVIATGSKK